MYAGKLRHRLTLESLTEAQLTASGEPAAIWSPEGNFWGQVEPLSGDELFSSRQVHPQITHRITMRYGVPVSPEKRLRWDSRVFGILAVINENERKRELQVACRELV